MGEAGIDPFTIAAILGHKSIAMKASYTHATHQAKLRAVEFLDNAGVESGPQYFIPKYEQQRAWRTNLRQYLNEAGERAIEADSS